MIHTHLADVEGRPANHQPKGYVNGQVLAAVSVLREKARAAYLALREVEQGTVDRALTLGKALLDLRRAYPADIAYGQALRDLGINQKTAWRCIKLAELEASGQPMAGFTSLTETGIWPANRTGRTNPVGQYCPTDGKSCASDGDESDSHGQHCPSKPDSDRDADGSVGQYCPTDGSSCAPVGPVGTSVPVDDEDPYPYSDEQLAAMGRLPKGSPAPVVSKAENPAPGPFPQGRGVSPPPAPSLRDGEQGKGKRADVVGQMTMDALYEAAERLHRMAERVSNCDLADEMVRKLVALMDEIEGDG